jgi:pyruvate dehydrogenase E1 component beta subunit
MVLVCLKAADLLASTGCDAEVIDLRTLWPWDREAVEASVERTGRLLVVHEAVRIGGFGGEIVADITERLFDRLKSAPRRLGAPRVPVPYSLPLETQCRISAEHVAHTAMEMTQRGDRAASR